MNGTRRPHGRFSPEQVIAIRRMRADGHSLREIAAAFRTNSGAIHRIVRGQTHTRVQGFPVVIEPPTRPAPPPVYCVRCDRELSRKAVTDGARYCSISCAKLHRTDNPCGAETSNWRGGKSFHPLYSVYSGMRQRCTNPNNDRWPSYGGRGITICQRWLDDFWNFVADMGERPAGHSLDRIDNDGPYSPENCRWATASEQRRNQRPVGVR